MTVAPAVARVGDSAVVEFRVVSTGDEPQAVLIDYAVVFQNVSGKGSRKVFKGKIDELGAGAAVTLRRKINLQQMTTRRILPGPHSVEAQVNGVVHAVVEFDVVG
jgi:hypothetical protein